MSQTAAFYTTLSNILYMHINTSPSKLLSFSCQNFQILRSTSNMDKTTNKDNQLQLTRASPDKVKPTNSPNKINPQTLHTNSNMKHIKQQHLLSLSPNKITQITKLFLYVNQNMNLNHNISDP